jgi:hypothetical protein
MKHNCEASPSKLVSSSRGAVETAIDISKGDRSTTWEEAVDKSLHRVTRWESPPLPERKADDGSD